MKPVFCYCCSDRSEYRIYDDLKPVCEYHRDEALDEENQPILVMAEENYQKMMDLRYQLRRIAI
jgi:hypothetical protein